MTKNSDMIKAQFEIKKILSTIQPYETKIEDPYQNNIGDSIGLLHSVYKLLNHVLPNDLQDDFKGGNALNRLKANQANRIGSKKK